MQLDRRTFLGVTGGVLVGLGALNLTGCDANAVGLGGRLFARKPADSPAPLADPEPAKPVSVKTGRTLVDIYLGGGNDGLNTVAPYGMGAYYDLRPTLGIKESEALPLAGSLGLHPNLKGLKGLYDDGKLTIVQGVGYPNPDRSHFRSFDIWATAQTKGVSPVGWLGRYLDLTGSTGQNPLRAMAIGSSIPKPLVGGTGSAIAVESLDNFQIKGTPAVTDAIRSMYNLGNGPLAVVRGRGQATLQAADAVQRLTATYKPGVVYPEKNGLAKNLQLIVRLLAGGSNAQVIYTTLGGFDEHANEKRGHDRLMSEFDRAVTAFQRDLEAHGLGDQVLTFVHSEFGRRARENASGGTDHGAAGPAFFIGTQVKGGLYGEHPSLTDLQDEDLGMGIDFRSLYATVLDGWLGGPVDEVIGRRFERLVVLRD